MTHRLLLCALCALPAGCTGGGVVSHSSSYAYSYSYSIPEGHMPPPGLCRIWYPDRPPGHQPPPAPCAELRDRVPPGADLIRG